ncbi:MAG: hypothetical protein RL748_251 [Pseudomonadota bacterium]
MSGCVPPNGGKAVAHAEAAQPGQPTEANQGDQHQPNMAVPIGGFNRARVHWADWSHCPPVSPTLANWQPESSAAIPIHQSVGTVGVVRTIAHCYRE